MAGLRLVGTLLLVLLSGCSNDSEINSLDRPEICDSEVNRACADHAAVLAGHPVAWLPNPFGEGTASLLVLPARNDPQAAHLVIENVRAARGQIVLRLESPRFGTEEQPLKEARRVSNAGVSGLLWERVASPTDRAVTIEWKRKEVSFRLEVTGEITAAEVLEVWREVRYAE